MKPTDRTQTLQAHIQWLRGMTRAHPIVSEDVEGIVRQIEGLIPPSDLTKERQLAEIAAQRALLSLAERLLRFGDPQHRRTAQIMNDIMMPLWYGLGGS